MALTVYSENNIDLILMSHHIKKDRYTIQRKTGYSRMVLLHIMIQFHKQT